MKPKNLKKKLELKKETVVTLGNVFMNQVRGGAPWTVGCTPSCDSFVTLCNCATGVTQCTCPRCYPGDF